ncbi:thioredoxin 1 [Lutibacter oricola]|uniref:Thioredoxin 1 n=1 Tax=Lutibacter oricola TaxID=762486 RepID=A0A1H2YV31_9FLAO|nr:thioredoxin family protein [Lutibacter oricola]SDX08439.1 thioredoxin 1 [Lutibacter oricola]
MNIKNTIASANQLDKVLKENLAVLLYFKTNSCIVGEAVEPKVVELLASYFPKIKSYSVDMETNADITAKYTAFVEPTVILFFDGKETIKKSRSFSIEELKQVIDRPYQLIFN